MKNGSLLAKKLELFYNDTQPKRTGEMHLQTDKEFNKIKQVNKKFDLEMYHTELPRGKAFAAEQKVREWKKILLRSKHFEKMQKKKRQKKEKKRIRPNQLIINAAENMNIVISTKYGQAPEKIEERSLDPNDGKYFQEVYDFVMSRKIQNQLKK